MAFAGDDGHLATAKVGDNTIDIWAPPSIQAQVVLNPQYSIKTDNNQILR